MYYVTRLLIDISGSVWIVTTFLNCVDTTAAAATVKVSEEYFDNSNIVIASCFPNV